MKFINILFQKFRFIGLLVLCMLISFSGNAQKNMDKKKQKKTVNVRMIVVDEKGSALSKAQVVVGEGIIHDQTDAQGTSKFSAFLTDFVTISSPGYEKYVTTVDQILKDNTIKLQKAKLFMTSEDDVSLPYLTMKKRNTTGGESVLSGSELEKYPSTDIRNAFTGLATGLEVIEKYGITGLNAEEKSGNYSATERTTMRLRGQRPIFIIDDVPTDITEMQLDPSEIESATVLKSIVAKSMFGPQAANGAIFIKTKRGNKNERVLNVNVERGVSMIDRMPKFVSGADYARLNNLARTNSGLTPLYSDKDIAAYAQNNAFDMYHPSNNFRDYMLKNTKLFQRANISSEGGSENVQYFANLGYDGEGDIYKIGSSSNFNKLNARANIDIKVNDYITTKLDVFGGLTFRKSPNYGYDTSFDIDEMNAVLDDITSISPIAFPIYAKNDNTVTKPWYGISTKFPHNPVGRLTEQGYYTETGRSGNIALTLNFDMKSILKGLKSKTYIDYQTLYSTRIGKATDYVAYIVTPSTTEAGVDTTTLTYARSSVDMSGQSRLHDYFYHRFSAYENLSYDQTWGKHAIQSMMTFFISKSVYDDVELPRRLINGMWNGNYTYNDKYSIQAVVNYAGSSTFKKGNRFQAFPAVGLSWVISEEDFMKKFKFINYLKLHADGGKLGAENFTSPYLTNTVYTYNTSGGTFGPAPTGYWFGTNRDYTGYQTYPTLTGNPDLEWETRNEYSLGLEALLLDHTLSLEANYYDNTRHGVITLLDNSLPYVTGLSDACPYYNYNSYRYFGFELGLQFTNKIGNVKYSVGGNATFQNSEYKKLDEPNYRFAYQSKVGKPTDAYFGHTYLGQFATDEETLLVPQLYDATLHAGDFKYKDMNGDGVVDDQDESQIGHTTPRLVYSVNMKIGYKGFDLTVIGTGRANYDIALTNKYFFNGWGDNTYSEFVKNHNGGAYPKLTYYKVNNNYQASNFWLTSGNFFKIQNVELAYTLPQQKARNLYTRGIRLFVRGANLYTFSKLKDVDPENISSGIESYPLYMTLTGGVNLTF